MHRLHSRCLLLGCLAQLLLGVILTIVVNGSNHSASLAVKQNRGCNITCACSHANYDRHSSTAYAGEHGTSCINYLEHSRGNFKVACNTGPQDVPPRRRLAIQGKTYTKEEREKLDKQIIKDINHDYDHHRKPRNLTQQHLQSQFHWRCESNMRPWQLTDGVPRVGLFFVLNRPQSGEKRAVLRQMFETFQEFPYKMSFAMGWPNFGPETPVSGVLRRVCQEQVAHGDLVLVNMRDNHNDGKTYYVFQEILVNITARSRYRFLIKLDDDSIVNVPALHNWITSKSEFTAENIMFGAPNGYGYLGAIEGVSTDMANKVIPVVPEFYRGMHFEDLLIGAWFRLWGENIVDVHFSGVEYYDVDFTNMTTNINFILSHHGKVIVVHKRKDTAEFLTLFRVLMTTYNQSLHD